jgi:hypothetical protein
MAGASFPIPKASAIILTTMKPRRRKEGKPMEKEIPTVEGMSLRDYFAGLALGLINHKTEFPGPERFLRAAEFTYDMADAMLAQAGKRDRELERLREGIQICLDAERERQKKLKPGAPATTYTEERIKKLEGLLA